MGIEQKVIVLTGVTSGLGRGMARDFARRGAKVVGAGRRRELGDHLVRELADADLEMRFVQTDVSVVEDCERLIEAAVEAHGRVDVLINNAGVVGEPAICDAHEATEEWWDHVMDVNLKGTFFCCRYALPVMRSQGGGVILNIASINAEVPVRGMQAYNASKAGVVNLSRGLATEYLADNVRVNAIILGGVDGDTASSVKRAVTTKMLGPDAEPAAFGGGIPAEQVAAFLAALASEEGAAVTGAAIPLDRGRTAGGLQSMAIYMLTAGLWKLPTA